MLWADKVDLSKYIATAGTFAGPIGKLFLNYQIMI